MDLLTWENSCPVASPGWGATFTRRVLAERPKGVGLYRPFRRSVCPEHEQSGLAFDEVRDIEGVFIG